jgi:hypothetical protein
VDEQIERKAGDKSAAPEAQKGAGKIPSQPARIF